MGINRVVLRNDLAFTFSDANARSAGVVLPILLLATAAIMPTNSVAKAVAFFGTMLPVMSAIPLAARALPQEREANTFDYLLSAPIKPTQLLFAKLLFPFITGLTTSWLGYALHLMIQGSSVGSPPKAVAFQTLAVAITGAATTLTAALFGMYIGVRARSPRSAVQPALLVGLAASSALALAELWLRTPVRLIAGMLGALLPCALLLSVLLSRVTREALGSV